MGGKWHGGKGDGRRTNANERKYREGWTRIFGQNNEKDKHNK